jgi:transcriptional regulator with PAS, ATPase and Fis domain
MNQLRHELQLQRMPHMESPVMNALLNYSWPGNVRELRNVLKRTSKLSCGISIERGHLGFDSPAKTEWSLTITFPEDRSPNDVTREAKSWLVEEALRPSGGSRQGAARLLGISRYSLKHYMNSLDLDWEDN